MIAMMIAKFVLVAIIGYLIGSIPFGALISKRVAKVDVREHGSGKTGATNVLRVAGKKAAVLVIVLDALKGVVAVLFAGLIVGGNYLVWRNFGLGLMAAQVIAALAAMAGHNWSIFLKFRGGRGVATFFGGMLVLCPVVALFSSEVFIIGAGLTRFVSLGSIAGVVGAYAILVPLTVLNGFPIEYLIYALIGTVAIVVMHRENIARLLAGKERRLGDRTETAISPPSGDNTG